MSFKYYVIFRGDGGLSLKDYIVSQGGGQDRPKKDHIIFERSLIYWYQVLDFILE